MKSNWFKYIFIIFVIGIMIFAVYKIRKEEEQKNQVQIQSNSKEEQKITEIKLGIARI